MIYKMLNIKYLSYITNITTLQSTQTQSIFYLFIMQMLSKFVLHFTLTYSNISTAVQIQLIGLALNLSEKIQKIKTYIVIVSEEMDVNNSGLDFLSVRRDRHVRKSDDGRPKAVIGELGPNQTPNRIS